MTTDITLKQGGVEYKLIVKLDPHHAAVKLLERALRSKSRTATGFHGAITAYLVEQVPLK